MKTPMEEAIILRLHWSSDKKASVRGAFAKTGPNIGLQLTPYSLRCASAFGSG
jgi:hypothetical protein